MRISMDLKERSYDIVVCRGVLRHAGEELNLRRKVLIVTDSGVPADYARTLAEQSGEAWIAVIPQGEENKNFEQYQRLLQMMIDHHFTRSDCVAAVGGGVVGDLAGFAASCYMRGIDFYNIPTTLLSQIDSSIGGKTAIDFGGYKNIVGAFYQPARVLIDPDVLCTLPERQVASGLAEAIKMSLTCDRELFEIFENEEVYRRLDEIIIRSLMIKKKVVEEDEKESGLRKVLNFGHTLGHGIESEQKGALYHGECVALGMIPMCSPRVRERLTAVLRKVGLPCSVSFDRSKVLAAAGHDKKFSGSHVTLIKVQEAGSFVMEQAGAEELSALLKILEEAK